jgi:hypothetical protein
VTLDLLSIAAQAPVEDDSSDSATDDDDPASIINRPPTPPRTPRTLCPALVGRAVQAATHAPGVVHAQADFLRCAQALLDLFDGAPARALLTSTSAGRAGHGGAQRHLILDLLESTTYRLEGRRRRARAPASNPGEAGEADEAEDVAGEVATLELIADQLVALMADVGAQWDVVDVANPADGLDALAAADDYDDVEGELARWLADAAATGKPPPRTDGSTAPGAAAAAGSESWRFARGAALMLGNAARSDRAATALLQRSGGEVAAAAVAVAARAGVDAETRHAAAGLLRNLAVAPGNRRRLARLGAWRAARALLAEADEQRLREVGCRLLRVLLRDERENGEEFVAGGPGSAFDAFMLAVERDMQRMGDGGDEAGAVRPVVLEEGRVVVSLCRTMALGADGGEVPAKVATSAAAVGAILSLVAQPELPARSEAFMGLALISRTTAGAETVYSAIQKQISIEDLCKVPDGDEPAAKSYRDNVAVLAQNLVASVRCSSSLSL